MICKKWIVYFKDGSYKIVWGYDKPQLYERYSNARSIFQMNKK